jgi:hypothetical protein
MNRAGLVDMAASPETLPFTKLQHLLVLFEDDALNDPIGRRSLSLIRRDRATNGQTGAGKGNQTANPGLSLSKWGSRCEPLPLVCRTHHSA